MKNMGFSHSPFKKLGFWASNVGNNSPAPSYRFHRKFADGFSHLKRQKTDSDIDSAGISGTSKPWAGLMEKRLNHTFAYFCSQYTWSCLDSDPLSCSVAFDLLRMWRPGRSKFRWEDVAVAVDNCGIWNDISGFQQSIGNGDFLFATIFRFTTLLQTSD